MYKAVTEEGYDCCGGKRKGRQGDGALRSFLSRSFYKVGKKLTKLDMSDGYGDFRMMRRTVVDALLEMKEYNRYMKGLYSFVGFTTKWIEYENVERVRGETKWSLKSLFSYAAEGIFSFSTVPLKLARTDIFRCPSGGDYFDSPFNFKEILHVFFRNAYDYGAVGRFFDQLLMLKPGHGFSDRRPGMLPSV